MMHIKTHRDYQPMPLRQFVQNVYRARRQLRPVPDTLVSAPVVGARINHGNWVADCPYCAGAASVDLDDLRFWCLSCNMAANGGMWLRVALPPEKTRKEIEALLLARPRDRQRNWSPGETPAALRAENKSIGVGGDVGGAGSQNHMDHGPAGHPGEPERADP